MTRVVACIPSIGLSPFVYDLTDALADAGVVTRIYVNQPDVTFLSDQFAPGHAPEIVDMHNQSIYQEWNRAAAWAADLGAHLLVLNDDIGMSSCLPGVLSAALDDNPGHALLGVGQPHPACDPGPIVDVSHQAGNRYEFSAWCFIARPSMWQDVDPRYRIWYGDDDLIWKTNAAGHRVGVLQGCGVTHHVSTTSSQQPWTAHAAWEDGELWTATGH